MFQGDECSGGWVSRGMGVPVTVGENDILNSLRIHFDAILVS